MKWDEVIHKFKAQQEEILKRHKEIEVLKETYRKEIYETFGLKDGESANVLEIMESVSRVINLHEEGKA